MNQNLLIVDDEEEILSWLAELFRYDFDSELGVYTANSAMEAIRLLSRVRFDVVLTDIRMPGMDGITLFQHIKENWPRCKTVFLTGYRNFEDIYRVINHKDVKYILKSEDDDMIMEAVRAFLVLSRQELEQEKSQKEQEGWLEEAKYWLKRELMNQILRGGLLEEADSRMKALGIPLETDRKLMPFLRQSLYGQNSSLVQGASHCHDRACAFRGLSWFPGICSGGLYALLQEYGSSGN